MASKSLKVQQSYATNAIDLGSDHRAVKACFMIGCARYYKKKPTAKMKGWRPILDTDGNATNFQLALSQQLVVVDTLKPEGIEQALHNAATTPNVSKASYDRTKPWDSIEIQSLLKQRRECTTAVGRRNVSKTIQKVSRRLIRKHNDEKVEDILKEFADLGRLDNISQYSKPKKEPSDKVGAEDFVKLLQKVYESDDAEIQVDKEKIVTPHFLL